MPTPARFRPQQDHRAPAIPRATPGRIRRYRTAGGYMPRRQAHPDEDSDGNGSEETIGEYTEEYTDDDDDDDDDDGDPSPYSARSNGVLLASSSFSTHSGSPSAAAEPRLLRARLPRWFVGDAAGYRYRASAPPASAPPPAAVPASAPPAPALPAPGTVYGNPAQGRPAYGNPTPGPPGPAPPAPGRPDYGHPAPGRVYGHPAPSPPPPPPASTTSSTPSARPPPKKDRPAPSYMPLWTCAPCADTMSVFARDEHCRTRAHGRAVMRAGESAAYVPPMRRAAAPVAVSESAASSAGSVYAGGGAETNHHPIPRPEQGRGQRAYVPPMRRTSIPARPPVSVSASESAASGGGSVYTGAGAGAGAGAKKNHHPILRLEQQHEQRAYVPPMLRAAVPAQVSESAGSVAGAGAETDRQRVARLERDQRAHARNLRRAANALTQATVAVFESVGSGQGADSGESVYSSSSSDSDSDSDSDNSNPAPTPQQQQVMFYCGLCAAEFPVHEVSGHDSGGRGGAEEVGVYMCVLCAQRVHIAGREAHARGAAHREMEQLYGGGGGGKAGDVRWARKNGEVGKREARFWGITADAAPDSVSAWPSFHRGGNTRKARKTAGAPKAREERQVNGGVVKVEWRWLWRWGAAEKKEEEEQVDDAARVAALVRWLGGLGVKKGDIEAGAPRPLENLRGGTRKERKMARDLAEAQKRRKEREADGGEVKCEWKCDVCEEPLLGEELVSHKAWHCRGGPGGGSKVEKGGEAGQQPPPWKARWRKEKEKEREEEEDVVVPAPPPLPRWRPSSSTTMPAREPQSQQQPQRAQAPSPPATATPALQPEVAPPPRTAPPPPQPQPPTYSTAITTATAPTALPTTFFCAPCNKTLPPANRTTHLASRKHLQNTQSTPQFFTPPTPQLFTPHLPAPTFIPPPPAPPPPPDLPYETYLCEQCNKWFGVSGRSGHEAAEKHKKRAAAWAARMREVHGPGWGPPTPPTPPAAEEPCAVPSAAQSAAPSAVPSAAPSAVETFFCTPCNKSFALLGRAGHLNGQKHTKKAAAIAGEAERRRQQQQQQHHTQPEQHRHYH
ncbi:uncharacterized protein LAJ45_03008 [Morchella importuna]|uniref:uncharacterized protein n=1 Tax=Morchella importuna TaxID=1174673 RepID=UPI001E8DE5C3|nr:uncharacterized protein LAJ45_03008 [Morchella importuna]KAH8152783.1 hypothetical protein LAJ45_03008 [Morchella importuna]